MFPKQLFSVVITLLLGLSGGPLYGDTFNGPTSLKEKSYEELIINGPTMLEEVQVKSLIVNGPLSFRKLKVSGKTEVFGPVKGRGGNLHEVIVKGPLKAEKFSSDRLQVSGPALLKDFEIKGNALFEDKLIAEKGTFRDLSLREGSKGEVAATLENVKVNDIAFVGSGEQLLHLRGKSEVTGKISFESGRGKLVIEGDQVIVKGKVEGAELAH